MKAIKNKDINVINKCRNVLESKNWGNINILNDNEINKEKYFKYYMISGSVLYTGLLLDENYNTKNNIKTISDCYKKALEVKIKNTKDEGLLYYEYAKFCNYIINNNELNIYEDIDKYIILYIENMMKSITCGNENSRNYIPHIFELLLNNDVAFNCISFDELNIFPLWYYLKWKSQLIGLLNTRLFNIIYNIFNNISDKYPQSLVYCLMVSEDNINENIKSKIEYIKSKIYYPIFSRFVNNLYELHYPHLKVVDTLKQVTKYIELNQKNKADILINSLYNDIVNNNKIDIGKYNRNWKEVYIIYIF